MTETVKLAIIISAAFRGGGAFDKAGGGLKGLKAGLKKIRIEMAAFAGLMAFNFLKKGFDVFVKFEQRMAEAGSILGATREEIAGFSDEIREMTKTLPQSADDLGAGLYDVFSAGITETAAAMDSLELAAQAAVAGLTDTATSVKAGISTMNAFGLSVEDMTHIYDVQFLTVKRGILRYNELSAVIGKIAPSAKAAGQSMEGMFGTLAFLTTKGMSAAEASTALGRAFDALTMPATVKKLREIGVSVADLSSELMQSDPILIGLRDAISGADDELRKINQDVLTATNEYSSQNSELLKLEAQYDSTKASMQEFSDELEGISITQRENRLEIAKIRQAADREGRELSDKELARIDEISEANDELSIKYEETALAQTKMSITAREQEKAVAGAQVVVDEASSALSSLKEQQVAASGAMDDANDKYDEIIAQTGNFRPLVDIVADLNTEMAGMSEIARAQAIAQIFPQIRARKAIISIMADTESLKANIDEMTDSTQSAGVMQAAFATNLDTTANDLKLMTNSVQELQIAISEDLLPIIMAFMDVIKPLIRFLSENTEVIWILIAAFIAYKVVMMAASIANMVFGTTLMATPIGWIMLAIAGLIILIVALVMYWDEITAAVKGFGETLWNFLKPIIDGIVEAFQWLVSALSDAWSFLGDIAGAIANFFGGLVNMAFGWGQDLLEMFIDGLISMVTDIAGVGKMIWDEISGWIGFDERANDMAAIRWGKDAGSLFAQGLKDAIPDVSIAAEDVRATLDSGLVSTDAVGVAGAVVGGGEAGTTVETHDTYEINLNIQSVEENMDMTRFVADMSKEIDRQKKTTGSVSSG